MKLFDNVRESLLKVWEKLEKKCPRCGCDLDIVPELMTKRFPVIECERCHLTLEVSTRNNSRMYLVILVVIPFSFALGVLFHTFF